MSNPLLRTIRPAGIAVVPAPATPEACSARLTAFLAARPELVAPGSANTPTPAGMKAFVEADPGCGAFLLPAPPPPPAATSAPVLRPRDGGPAATADACGASLAAFLGANPQHQRHMLDDGPGYTPEGWAAFAAAHPACAGWAPESFMTRMQRLAQESAAATTAVAATDAAARRTRAVAAVGAGVALTALAAWALSKRRRR